MTDTSSGVRVARMLLDAFEVYRSTFLAVTLRAQHRFEQRDPGGARKDAAFRLGLYDEFLNYVQSELDSILETNRNDRGAWHEAKDTFSELTDDRYDRELAQTFFNSVTRRVHGTVGLDEGFEYYDSDFEIQSVSRGPSLTRLYSLEEEDLGAVLSRVLEHTPFVGQFQAPRGDCARVANYIEEQRVQSGEEATAAALEMLQPVFYRDGMAYLIGRFRYPVPQGVRYTPMVLPLESTPVGIAVDAVLLTEDQVSILFSFARSYFFVATQYHQQLLHFLQSVLPRKRLDELYASLGHHKHGKTELHRGLRWHLARCSDRFEYPPGKTGMVMIAFTLPSFDVVFKVIRDRVTPPKRCDRQRVLDAYELVFKHDRVGRMVDAQEFVNLEFNQDRFEPELLWELISEAAETVELNGDLVTFRHLYTERRVTPLDVYIRERPEHEAVAALVDYGHTIKELAVADIFPGDLFLKNFGVTRHGRVVFYDYDEVCKVTDCRFRVFPKARHDYQEMEDIPWFAVKENDIFPEEFRTFLGIPLRFRGAFERVHGDLFEADFWRSVQTALRAGEVIDVRPYKSSVRFALL